MKTNQLGCLIIDLESEVLSLEERELLAHPLVGGVILFARNYKTKAQLNVLCSAIRAARKQPLLIMVDQEGGRVQRFQAEFTRLPPLGQLGDMYLEAPEKACECAKQTGRIMAAELLSVQIDLSLAPVLDMNKQLNNVIGDRAFHAEASVIIPLANAFIKGMQEAGMAATGKHFPGHGSVTLDSHMALPTDNRTFDQVLQEDMQTFIALIQQGIPAMMAAHIVFPQVDKYPVGYSAIWLQDILRKKLGFTGVIFSDDLNMEGANISADCADRVMAARTAGCDFALLCNNRKGVISALDHVALATVPPEKWQPLVGKANKTLHTSTLES